MKKNLPTDIVYSDIFPASKIAKGNSSFMKWSLEGCFFNYLGAGLEGTLTGRGGNCLAAGTLVSTNKGEVPIEQICSNTKDYLVLSCDTNSGKILLNKILAARSVDTNESIEFETESGRKITCTKEHRFFDGSRFKCADQFRIGDFFYAIKEQEKQEVLNMREEKRRERPNLQGLLHKVKEFTHQNKVRSLRKILLQADAGVQQGNEKKLDRESLLLTGMCKPSTKNKKRRKMLCLWEEIKAREKVLFAKMQGHWGEWNKEEVRRQDMPTVWHGIQTKEPFNAVLLEGVCEQSPLLENVGDWESGLQKWAKLFKRVSRSEKERFKKRQLHMHYLREEREKNNSHVEGAGNTKNKSYMPPLRQGRDKQQDGEHNNCLQHVSSTYSQIEKDKIISIKYYNKSQKMYDIQVDNVSNYFACSLLVHNCTIID